MAKLKTHKRAITALKLKLKFARNPQKIKEYESMVASHQRVVDAIEATGTDTLLSHENASKKE